MKTFLFWLCRDICVTELPAMRSLFSATGESRGLKADIARTIFGGIGVKGTAIVGAIQVIALRTTTPSHDAQ